jgi:hypothetical protein
MQQLILLTLVALLIGVALLAGLETSQDSLRQANEFAVVHEAMTIVGYAQAWYRRPKWLGGGGGSFSDFTLEVIRYNAVSVNGHFIVSEQKERSFRLTGIGKEGDPPLRVTLEVFANSLSPIQITQ